MKAAAKAKAAEKFSATAAGCREPGQAVSADYLRRGSLRYAARDRAIVGRNLSYFNNRPLYCPPQTESVVLTGDRPLVRLLAKPYVQGAFMAAIVRGGRGRWLHEYPDIESRYRCGRMAWLMADPAWPGLRVRLEAVPLQAVGGFALRFQADGVRAGDQLVWAFGGAKLDEFGDPRGRWDPIYCGNPQVRKTGDPRIPSLSMGWMAEWCRGNLAVVTPQGFQLWPHAAAEQIAVGRLSRAGKIQLADASAGGSPQTLLASVAGDLPLVCGAIDLQAGQDEIHCSVAAVPSHRAQKDWSLPAPEQDFAAAKADLETVERVRVATPEPRLDAAVAAVCHAIDAACEREPFIFRHGCMTFSIQFLGWRVIYGSTVLGWHERVRGSLAYYGQLQVQRDKVRVQPQAGAQVRYCHEGPRSRFWGRGRLAPNPEHSYDTQTQFFDQAIHNWRWTADRELERILRPALELHLAWARDCFDADDDGLYESYINVLPSDSVWYNGGAGVEASAYAYTGHRAAMAMARRAGDRRAAARHRARANKIRRALRAVLWRQDRGHFGLYREQGGLRRVHPDAWVYSQFLPIDAGLLTPAEALQALYFTEWGLERLRLPFGGVLCQPSNWVPSKWSVRDMFGGDMFHLALAYFQTGLPDEGWELFLGAMLESAYASAVPGGFSQIGVGTDFADNSNMFARAVAEGLFGFTPDYPQGVVRLRPAFPTSWPRASIQTPDFTFEFRRAGRHDCYRLTLARKAKVEFLLPARARRVRRVTLNGRAVRWRAEPGCGGPNISIHTGRLAAAEVHLELERRLPYAAAVAVSNRVGAKVCLAGAPGKIVRWRDFHGALENARAAKSKISGRLARRPGYHLVLAEVKAGALPLWQLFKVRITDPAGAARRAARTPRTAPARARWQCVDLAAWYNGDIRTIFQQPYRSPRPKTCSVRLGLDGYSAWTFPYWGEQPPKIDLSNLPQLARGSDRIITPQHVPFRRFAGRRNIAFTSRWDNWPRAVQIPLAGAAEVIWLLLCGSTFPMQNRIANAELRFRYADEKVEKLELIPPLNFWSLCPWGGIDYSYEVDGFCLPRQPPPMVQLGNNCRAMVLAWRLRPGAALKTVTLQALSQEVVIGLMGLSLMNPRKA